MANFIGNILSSFRPDVTETAFLEAINKYGAWNVVKIKKNFWMLLPAIRNIVIGLLLFLFLLALTYWQYYNRGNFISFYVIGGCYIFLTLWWLLVSFSRIIKNKKEEKIFYEEVSSWTVKNLKQFKSFVVHTLTTMFLQAIIWLVNVILAIIQSATVSEYWMVLIQGLINYYFIHLMYQILKKIIDSEMDFMIATPTTMTFYSQTWLLQSNSNIVNNTQIKTFNATLDWFWPSFLGYGTILIRTEWDDLSKADLDNHDTNRLKLRFVLHPKKVIQKLEEIIRSPIREDPSNPQYKISDFVDTEAKLSFITKMLYYLLPSFLIPKDIFHPKVKSTEDLRKIKIENKIPEIKKEIEILQNQPKRVNNQMFNNQDIYEILVKINNNLENIKKTLEK